MLVENHDELVSRIASLLTELVDPLDRLDQHALVEPVRIVRGWRCGLLEPDVEDEATESLDLVEQPIRELSKLTVSSHVGDGEEAGSLLLPHGGVFTRPLDLEIEHLALALEEPCPEPAHFCSRQHESGEAEHRTVLVFWVCAADLAARGKSPAAFDRRCIPLSVVVHRSNTAGIFPLLALLSGRIADLGATRGFTTNC